MANLDALERETAALRAQGARMHAAPDDDTVGRHGTSSEKTVAEIKASKQMWVDKYRPKRFADLLGEDVSWDHSVGLGRAEKRHLGGGGAVHRIWGPSPSTEREGIFERGTGIRAAVTGKLMQ